MNLSKLNIYYYCLFQKVRQDYQTIEPLSYERP